MTLYRSSEIPRYDTYFKIEKQVSFFGFKRWKHVYDYQIKKQGIELTIENALNGYIEEYVKGNRFCVKDVK